MSRRRGRNVAGGCCLDAIRQSLGKLPAQRLALIGTRAPSEAEGWWPELLSGGSGDGVHVTDLHAGPELVWDSYDAVKAANPLVLTVDTIRRRVLRERDEARRNPTMRPAYEAYRLNRGGATHEQVLVTRDDWRIVEHRDVPRRAGRPVVGIDLARDSELVCGVVSCGPTGAARSSPWSVASRTWPSVSGPTPCRRACMRPWPPPVR